VSHAATQSALPDIFLKGLGSARLRWVIFFVPDPAKGVAEMTRLVRPGGIIATYAWDMFGGGLSAGADSDRNARARHQGAAAAERPGIADGRVARAVGGSGA
jgi:hypothetical protein